MTDDSKKQNYIVLNYPIIIAADDIEDVKGMQFQSDDKDLDFQFVIRATLKNPQVDFTCANLDDAKYLFKFLTGSKKVVNFNDFKHGK